MYSLRARTLLITSLVLAACFAALTLALDMIFQRTAEQAVHERLEVRIIALLSAVELDADGELDMLESPPDPRLASPGTGLYARIVAADGALLWRSPSSVGLEIPYPGAAAVGEQRFARVTASDGRELFAESMAIAWELESGGAPRLVFEVAESAAPYAAELGRFRRQLLVFFGLALIALVAVQAATLRWLMRPLERVQREIVEVEEGRRTSLGTGYPRELARLAENLNALVRNERARLERYRTTLGNLAHSLKTPLAVIRGAVDRAPEGGAPDRAELREQLDRVDAIVAHQLQRAALSGGTSIGAAPVPIGPAVEKLTASLAKIYASKSVRAATHVDPGARFFGDEGDLMELLGNLADNAFKWCEQRVRLSARARGGRGVRRPGLEIRVEDDGPGIGEDARAHVLARGGRADESTPGHGIGLAVVRELVELHGGTLDIGRSEALGGAEVRVALPAR